MSTDPDENRATGNPLDPRRRPSAAATPGPDGVVVGEGYSGGTVDDRGAPGEAAGTTSEGPPSARRGAGDEGGGGAPAQDATDPEHRRVPPSHAGAQSTDPDPGDTPGLDAGGGVVQGDTPPIESGTSGLSSPQKEGSSRALSFFVPVGIIALVVIAVVALLVGRLAGG